MENREFSLFFFLQQCAKIILLGKEKAEIRSFKLNPHVNSDSFSRFYRRKLTNIRILPFELFTRDRSVQMTMPPNIIYLSHFYILGGIFRIIYCFVEADKSS
jgi:hypothetical protein